MSSWTPVTLQSSGRLRLTEFASWFIAAFLLAMSVALLADGDVSTGFIPLAVIAAFFGWVAWRQRQRRRQLAALNWDELLPVIRQQDGAVFEEAVQRLQAAGDGTGAPPRIEESDDCRRHRALLRLRPGLWVELSAKDQVVRSIRAGLDAADAPADITVAAPSPGLALALAAALVLFDGLMFGQGILSLFLGLALLAGRLPFILLSRQAALRRPRLRNLAVYLGAVAVVLLLVRTNARLAEDRADGLVAALKAHHEKYHRYPGSLDELVPEFTPAIPPARYVMLDNRFRYAPRDNGPLLSYTTLPPFGRRAYDFSTGAWTAYR